MAYRLPILILSFFMIQIIPRVLKREGVNSVTAWTAPYLLLLLPKFIYYSQEVRAWMPMAVCLFLWGVYRKTPGCWGWVLCTLALQANTFSFFYIAIIGCMDWGYWIWKKEDKPPLPPVVALITHIPSLVFLIYRFGSRFPSEQPMNTGFISRFFDIKPTIEYITTSFQFYFEEPPLLWIVLAAFTLVCLFWKVTHFKRFWIGILIGILIHAHLLKVNGPFVAPRYLIMMLPLFCIVPFLFQWKQKHISAAVAILIVLTAHLTPQSLNIKETVSKGDRSYISKPWKGVASQLFSRTSTALIHSERNDWKHLTLLLNALVEPDDLVLFKSCKGCYIYPLMFYDRGFGDRIRVKREGDDPECANWIVSTHALQKNEMCDLSLIGRLDQLYVYGQPTITIQNPIYYSRSLELEDDHTIPRPE